MVKKATKEQADLTEHKTQITHQFLELVAVALEMLAEKSQC